MFINIYELDSAQYYKKPMYVTLSIFSDRLQLHLFTPIRSYFEVVILLLSKHI